MKFCFSPHPKCGVLVFSRDALPTFSSFSYAPPSPMPPPPRPILSSFLLCCMSWFSPHFPRSLLFLGFSHILTSQSPSPEPLGGALGIGPIAWRLGPRSAQKSVFFCNFLGAQSPRLRPDSKCSSAGVPGSPQT